MEYQQLFNRKFFEIIILLILGFCAALFFVINKSYWNRFEFLRNNKAVMVAYKLLLPIIVLGYLWMVALPMIKDKPNIDANDFEIRNGVASQGVVNGGLLGLSKSIIVEVDGEKCEYGLVGYDNEIKKGDKVKVIFLPHSKYAVIEKLE